MSMYCLYSINLNPLVTRGLTRGLIHYSGLQGAHGGTSGVVDEYQQQHILYL